MTRDEQRQAWRVYAAALLAGDDVDLQAVVKAADWMVQEERKRFNPPDHSGDANKMVEPREWVDLTEAEIRQIVATFYPTQADRVRHTQDLLREKNGGTR